MERLTKRSNVGEGLPVKHLNLRHEDTTSEDTLTEILDKLAEYEDAEEKGLLVRLPIPIGTKCFIATQDCVMCDLMDDCNCLSGEKCIYMSVNEIEFQIETLKLFGKTVFLTRSEAEQALKGMEDDL